MRVPKPQRGAGSQANGHHQVAASSHDRWVPLAQVLKNTALCRCDVICHLRHAGSCYEDVIDKLAHRAITSAKQQGQQGRRWMVGIAGAPGSGAPRCVWRAGCNAHILHSAFSKRPKASTNDSRPTPGRPVVCCRQIHTGHACDAPNQRALKLAGLCSPTSDGWVGGWVVEHSIRYKWTACFWHNVAHAQPLLKASHKHTSQPLNRRRLPFLSPRAGSDA
jgi:hypothetical protein